MNMPPISYVDPAALTDRAGGGDAPAAIKFRTTGFDPLQTRTFGICSGGTSTWTRTLALNARHSR